MGSGIILGMDALSAEQRGGVVSIGNFDGVHLGHQRILRAAAERARSTGAPLLAATFDPEPEAILVPERADLLIVPMHVKCRLLRQCGTDWVLVIPTTRELLSLRPEEFVRRVLVDSLAATCVVEGPDFRFGQRRAGDVHTLRASGRGRFDVVEVSAVTIDLPAGAGQRVSSSLIRRLVAAGDVSGARQCLGRAYTLYGRVVPGERRGRLLEFPTANVDASGLVVPGDGIYAAWGELGGSRYPAAVSVGSRPTFGPGPRTVEAHLVDAGGEFYGREIALAFQARLRDQVEFPDAQALRAQIAKDVRRVRELCQ